MKDSEFLNWVAERMVCVYGESPNVDFVRRARDVADRIESQAREIAGLQKLLDRAHMRMDELKSQPSGVVELVELLRECADSFALWDSSPAIRLKDRIDAKLASLEVKP